MDTPGTLKRSRRIRRNVNRSEEVLTGTLQPGEQLRSCLWVQKHMNYAYKFLLGEWVYILAAKSYFVAASERRFFLLASSRLSQRPKKLFFVDELSQISISKRRGGVFYDRWTFTPPNRECYEFRVHRMYRRELEALIALREAAQAEPRKTLATSYRKFS